VAVAAGALVLAAISYAATIDIRLGAILLGAALALFCIGLVVLQLVRQSEALDAIAEESAAELESLRESMADRLETLQREVDGRVAQLAEVEQRLLASGAEIADLRRRVAAGEAATERLAAAAAVTLLPAFAGQAAQIPPGLEWAELWPDLADAPTVVDLAAWATPFADAAEEGAAAAS
jgi:septal ring factor EnvC (AmiA/AmiB activator)